TSVCLAQPAADSLVSHIESYLEEHRIPGAMVSAVRADTVLYVGGVGYADLDRREPVTAEHLFRQGSISKTFTALGLYLLLREAGHELDTPIREIDAAIPFENPWESEHPVRVAHLLEHTSGFEDFHLHAMYNPADSVMPPVVQMVQDHRQSLTSRWTPGTRKAYSNPNYVVAGHLIEAVSGRRFNDYVRDRVLEPIGMASSGYYFKKPPDVSFAQGYQRQGTTLTPIPFATINGSPAGDFAANATDMAAFLQLMLNRDTLFTAGEFGRIERPETSLAAKHGLAFGYGLGTYSVWKNGYRFYGHGGEIDGFAARFVYSREADLGVAIAINRNGNANAVLGEVLDHLLGTQTEAPSHRVTRPIPEAMKRTFAGFYEFKSPKGDLLAFSDRMLAGLTLDFQNDKLITRTLLGKARDTLYHAGNGQFFLNHEGAASAMLIERAGAPVFWINDSYTERESRIKRLLIFFGLLMAFVLQFAFLVYGLVWLGWNAFAKEKTSPLNRLLLMAAPICLILLFTGFGLTVSEPESAMHMSPSSLLLYLSSYALVVVSIASAVRWGALSGKKSFRVFYILTSAGALALSIYLWNAGFIGLKLWSY
ncbi:MAG: serine hydrolase domain-containing protein, partial [Bacteroidota bacterium]